MTRDITIIFLIAQGQDTDSAGNTETILGIRGTGVPGQRADVNGLQIYASRIARAGVPGEGVIIAITLAAINGNAIISITRAGVPGEDVTLGPIIHIYSIPQIARAVVPVQGVIIGITVQIYSTKSIARAGVPGQVVRGTEAQNYSILLARARAGIPI